MSAAGSQVDDLRWQPPEGFDWEDFPDGTRLVQAVADHRSSKKEMEVKLESQLKHLAKERPLRYAFRMRALAAVDPTSSLSHPTTMRHSADAIEASYHSLKIPSLLRPATSPALSNACGSTLPSPTEPTPSFTR